MTELEPVNLIVEPDMEMSASPAELDPEQEFEVTGTLVRVAVRGLGAALGGGHLRGCHDPDRSVVRSSPSARPGRPPSPLPPAPAPTRSRPPAPTTRSIRASASIEIDDPVGPPVDLQAVAADVAPAAVEETYATIEVEVVAADQPVARWIRWIRSDPADAPAPTGAVQPAVVEPDLHRLTPVGRAMHRTAASGGRPAFWHSTVASADPAGLGLALAHPEC